MDDWRRVFRDGLAPLLSVQALEALRQALASDDPRLIQGGTVLPLVHDWPVDAACPVAFCGWQAEDLGTVAEVEEFSGRMCHEIDQCLGEGAACRGLLNWIDESSREEMRTALLAEVNLTLAEREKT